jgi:hypothetical protein
MGLTLSSPAPQLSTDFIPAFDYQTYFIRDAGEGVTFHFPAETGRSEDEAWDPRGLPGEMGEEWYVTSFFTLRFVYSCAPFLRAFLRGVLMPLLSCFIFCSAPLVGRLSTPRRQPSNKRKRREKWLTWMTTPREMVRTQWAGTPGLGQGAEAQAVDVWSKLSFAQWAVGDPAVVDGGMTGEAPAAILLVEGVFEGDFLEAPRLAAVAA